MTRVARLVAAVSLALLMGALGFAPVAQARPKPLPLRVSLYERPDDVFWMNDPTAEQQAAADMIKLKADARDDDRLVFTTRFLDLPETTPFENGYHTYLHVYFTTTRPDGSAPISGSVSYISYEGWFRARVDDQDCPGALTLADPVTDRIRMEIDKSCFPGAKRRVTTIKSNSQSGHYIGYYDDTNELCYDHTGIRQSEPFRLRTAGA